MLAQLPKAVIFDLDGTLVDSVPDLTTAVNLALKEVANITNGVTIDEIRQWVGNGSLRLIERAVGHCQQGVSVSDVHASFLQHYESCHAQSSHLYAGIMPLLEQLEQLQIKMAVVTNKPMVFVPSLLASLKIARFFDPVLGGDSCDNKKPHPEPLLACLASWDLPPEQVVMVGDSQSDAMAAQAANIPCFLLEQGYNQGIDLHTLPSRAVFKDMTQLMYFWFNTAPA